MFTKVFPIFIAMIVVSAFLFLNLDGWGRWKLSLQHGWPIVALHRSEVQTVVSTFAQPKGYGPSSRWPFDNAYWIKVDYVSLVINALIMSAVTLDAFLWSRRVAKNGFRLSITRLMEITFVVAVVVSCPLFSGLEVYEFIATFIAVSCMHITGIRIVHELGGRLLRFILAKSRPRIAENER